MKGLNALRNDLFTLNINPPFFVSMVCGLDLYSELYFKIVVLLWHVYGSVLENTCCPCRKPNSVPNTQIVVPGNLMPSSDLHQDSGMHVAHIHIFRQ